MSDEKNQEPEVKKAEVKTEVKEKKNTLSISTDEISAIVSAAVTNAVEKSAEIFGQALVEARKPYIDPRTEQNAETFRENTRRQEALKKQRDAIAHKNCSHLQGGLGDYVGTRTAIVWHQLDDTKMWGICTVCQRQFRQTDEDFRFWYAKPSANITSKAGQRYVMQPVPFQPEVLTQ